MADKPDKLDRCVDALFEYVAATYDLKTAGPHDDGGIPEAMRVDAARGVLRETLRAALQEAVDQARNENTSKESKT